MDVQSLHDDRHRRRNAAPVRAVRDRDNLPQFGEIYPGRSAPVLRRSECGGLKLKTMTWGFPDPAVAKGRLVTNVRNLDSPFWRSALSNPDRRCLVPVTRFCEWTAEPDPVTKRKSKVWFGLHEGDDPLFAFAGIWRPGPKDRSDGPYMAFLTCDANEVRCGASQSDAGHTASIICNGLADQ